MAAVVAHWGVRLLWWVAEAELVEVGGWLMVGGSGIVLGLEAVQVEAGAAAPEA